MNRQKIAGELVKLAKELVSSDIMIAESIMSIIFGSKRAVTKLSNLTADFRDEISGGEDGERKLSHWDEIYSATMRALRTTDLVNIISKRMIDMWAEHIAGVIVYDKGVPPRFQQKTAELIGKSGIDTAQLGRDMNSALLKKLKGSFEMVYFQ